MKIITFDLETAKIPDLDRIAQLEDEIGVREMEHGWDSDPEGDDADLAELEAELKELKRIDPTECLGITCAGLARFDMETAGNLYAAKTMHDYTLGTRADPADRFSVAKAWELMTHLARQHSQGHIVVTWNGLFDWHVLGVEAADRSLAAWLAMRHVDLMFAFHAIRGFPLSLKAAAEACGGHKGTEDIEDGALAPQMWADGEYDKVLQYVKQDAVATMDVAVRMMKDRQFSWLTKKGKRARFELPAHVRTLEDMTVAKVINWPHPDQSWMDTPIPRDSFSGWIKEEINALKNGSPTQ